MGLTAVLKQQPQCHMPSHAFANSTMCPLQVSFFSELSLPLICFYMFVSAMAHAFYFQVPFWMSYLPVGAQLFGFAPLHPLEHIHWQAYVHCGNGHWPTPGMH